MTLLICACSAEFSWLKSISTAKELAVRVAVVQSEYLRKVLRILNSKIACNLSVSRGKKINANFLAGNYYITIINEVSQRDSKGLIACKTSPFYSPFSISVLGQMMTITKPISGVFKRFAQSFKLAESKLIIQVCKV
jgi:hypothetical protein